MNKVQELVREGYLREELSGRGPSKCKDPEVGPCLIASRNCRDAMVPKGVVKEEDIFLHAFRFFWLIYEIGMRQITRRKPNRGSITHIHGRDPGKQ